MPADAGRNDARDDAKSGPSNNHADNPAPKKPDHASTDDGGAKAPPPGESHNVENLSYAKMVTKFAWTLQESNKKRKRNKSSPRTKPNLKGIHQKPKRDIYMYMG